MNPGEAEFVAEDGGKFGEAEEEVVAGTKAAPW